MNFTLSYDVLSNYLSVTKTTFEKEIRYVISYGSIPSTLTVQIPTFLLSARGFYLGQIYPIQFEIEGRLQYLNFTNIGSSLKIQYYTPSESLTSKSVGIQFLKNIEGTTFKYNQKNTLTEMVFYNFIPFSFLSPLTVATSIIITLKSPGQDDNIIFSVAECNADLDCKVCGLGSCPEGFTCKTEVTDISLNNTGTLAPSLLGPSSVCEFPITTGQTFGIRYKSESQLPKVLTYTLSDNNSKITLNFVAEKDIFASTKFSVNTYPKEQYVFIDDSKMLVGGHYPLFIFINTSKKYLVKPVTKTTNIIEYDLSDNFKDSLTFSPTTPGKWRSFVFSSLEFKDLPISSALKMGLWQNLGPINTVAVEVPPDKDFIFWVIVILFLVIIICGIVYFVYTKRK